MKAAVVTLGVVLLIGLGAVLGPRFLGKARFAGFPGRYVCSDFGLPDKDHSTVIIDDNLVVTGAKADGSPTPVGHLEVMADSRTRAYLRLDAALFQNKDWTFDESADYLAEGIGASLVFSSQREGQLLFSQPCYRDSSTTAR